MQSGGNIFRTSLERYLEPRQISWIKLFAKIVNGWKLLHIFSENATLDVWVSSEYVSGFSSSRNSLWEARNKCGCVVHVFYPFMFCECVKCHISKSELSFLFSFHLICENRKLRKRYISQYFDVYLLIYYIQIFSRSMGFRMYLCGWLATGREWRTQGYRQKIFCIQK